MTIYIINGPNLNLLGIRDTELYGSMNYLDFEKQLTDMGLKKDVVIECFQSNHEGALIDKIHQAHFDNIDGIVINPGALTHYSYALRDAIEAVKLPVVEVHLTLIHERKESFRHHSVISEVCQASFMGEHIKSYEKAIDFLINNA